LKETLSSFEEESKIQFEKLTSVYGEINKDLRKTIKGPLKPKRYIELERRKAILSPQLAEIKRYDEKKKDIEKEIRRLLSSLKDS